MIKTTLICVLSLSVLGFLLWLLLSFKKQGKIETVNKVLEVALDVQEKVIASFNTHERARARRTELQLGVIERIRKRREAAGDGGVRSDSGETRSSNDSTGGS